jgi:hypothetical protein
MARLAAVIAVSQGKRLRQRRSDKSAGQKERRRKEIVVVRILGDEPLERFRFCPVPPYNSEALANPAKRIRISAKFRFSES